MGTKGRVRIVDVSTQNIREVSDLDQSIRTTNVTGSNLFTDNDLKGEYIDPNYCVGEDNPARLETLTTKPYAFGEFRNYGGTELDPGLPEIYFKSIVGKGINNGNNIEFIPQTTEGLQYLNDNNAIVGVTVIPDPNTVDTYVSSTVVESKQLVDEYHSVMFRKTGENALNISDLGIKVGLDYKQQLTAKKPLFSYNITIYYGDIPIEVKVKTGDGSTSVPKAVYIGPVAISGDLLVAAISGNESAISQLFDWLSGPLSKYLAKLSSGVDKAVTQFATTGVGATLTSLSLYAAMILVADSIWDLFQNPTSVADGFYRYRNLVDGMYTYDDLKSSKYQIAFGDLFTGNNSFVSKNISKTESVNYYDATTQNEGIVYLTNQIAFPSGWTAGTGWSISNIAQKTAGVESSITKPLSLKKGLSYEGTISIANSLLTGNVTTNLSSIFSNLELFTTVASGASGSITFRGIANTEIDNILTLTASSDFQGSVTVADLKAIPTQFPSDNIVNDDVTKKKYANFKFFPKCNQYDLATPPPIITFKIELEAIDGCILSSTKPTAFTVSIAPDKYMAPVFDVITPTGRATKTKPILNINTPVTFQNARYADAVALLDREKNGGWFNLFAIYQNSYIRTDGRDDNPYTNKDIKLTGSDIVSKGIDVFKIPLGGGYKLPETSDYEVAFLQEAQGNIIKNSTFRLERLSEDPDDETNLMRKYWYYDSSWEIRDGAIYRDSAGNQVDGVYQPVDNLRYVAPGNIPRYYFFDIDCTITSGTIGVKTNGVFYNDIYNWTVIGYSESKYNRPALNIVDYPSGVVKDSGAGLIKFNTTGSHRVILSVLPGISTGRNLTLVPSEDFVGRINNVSLQYLPTYKIDESGRNCTNAVSEYGQNRLFIRWEKEFVPEKTIKLQFSITTPTTVTFKFTPYQNEVTGYVTTVNWGNTSGSPDIDVFENMTYQEYTATYSYLIPGIYTVEITNTYNGSNLYESFKCNESELIYFKDENGLLYQGSLDLSNSNVGLFGGVTLGNNLSDYNVPLKELNLSNTPITGTTDDLPSITDYLNISNTTVSGDVIDLYDIASIDISNSAITTCSPLGQPTGEDGNKSIVWINSLINEEQFINLIKAISLSSINSGFLNIGGENVPIQDEDTLYLIENLTTNIGETDSMGVLGRGWNIIYNTVDSESILDAILTEDSDYYITTEDSNFYIKQQ